MQTNKPILRVQRHSYFALIAKACYIKGRAPCLRGLSLLATAFHPRFLRLSQECRRESLVVFVSQSFILVPDISPHFCSFPWESTCLHTWILLFEAVLGVFVFEEILFAKSTGEVFNGLCVTWLQSAARGRRPPFEDRCHTSTGLPLLADEPRWQQAR
ncbi:hypothetical protein BsWGS_08780 [Bradybaena similaris]